MVHQDDLDQITKGWSSVVLYILTFYLRVRDVRKVDFVVDVSYDDCDFDDYLQGYFAYGWSSQEKGKEKETWE